MSSPLAAPAPVKLPARVYLYFFCQSLTWIAAVTAVTIAAAVGLQLATNPAYATVPYGIQFLALLLLTYPLAQRMKNHRKQAFAISASSLLVGGIAGFMALQWNSFGLLILAHACIGFFIAGGNFYRFAATEGLPAASQARALSLVVASGVLAGVIAPPLSNFLRAVDGFPLFSFAYLILCGFAGLNLILIYYLPAQPSQITTASQESIHRESSTTSLILPTVLVAIVGMAFGHGLMNLLMIQASLHMHDQQIAFADTAQAIQWHVIAMFFPSFFTGSIINRFGVKTIITVGFGLFLASFLLNILAQQYIHLAIALILLGLAWNFAYVGSSTLLMKAVQDHPQQKKWQGIGEMTIALFAFMGAMSPSLLIHGIGWINSNWFASFLCVAPLAGLAYLRQRQRGLFALSQS